MDDEPVDPEIYAAWKKDIASKLKQAVIFREKIPTVLKRCPKCQMLSLEFDPTTARIFCTRCGFEEHLNL